MNIYYISSDKTFDESLLTELKAKGHRIYNSAGDQPIQLFTTAGRIASLTDYNPNTEIKVEATVCRGNNKEAIDKWADVVMFELRVQHCVESIAYLGYAWGVNKPIIVYNPKVNHFDLPLANYMCHSKNDLEGCLRQCERKTKRGNSING